MSDIGAEDTPAKALRLLQASRFAEARRLLSEYCRAQPTVAYGWFLLGAACHRLGDLDAALSALQACCELSPDFVQAFSALGAVQLALGRRNEALATYRRALELEARDPQLWTNAGVAQGELNDWEAALQSYDQALACDSGFVPALMNRGHALSKLGRIEDALINNNRFAELNPELADAHYNRAEALLALSRFDEALAASERASVLAPQHAGAHFDRGLALACLGRLEDAAAAFEASRVCDSTRFASLCRSGGLIVQDEGGLDARALYLLRLLAQQEACDWRRRDELAVRFEALVKAGADSQRPLQTPELLFSSLAVPLSPDTRLSLARSIAAGFARRAATPRSGHATRKTSEHIRLGYCSPDFHVHPVGLLTQDLFGFHDRSRFRVFAYSLHPDDGSDVRRKIASGVDRFEDVSDWSDDAIAQRVADDGIDVLIDLAGYTQFGRSGVFARRPADIQVNYLGYAGSLGADYMDYAIVDPVISPPDSDRHWTEKLVRLPAVFSPGGGAIPPLPARQRRELGLPDSAFVFCCFANNYKIDPSIFDTWMAILTRVPTACLWLTQSHSATQPNLRREAHARGVEPSRIVFAPRESFPAYMARYRLADLFLDTRWFNAHTTAIDALRCGVPVLTIAGETMASRLGASVLAAAGLPELVTHSLDHYEARAVALAQDAAALQALRGKLQTAVRGSALFDTQARARELEAAYAEMVARHRRGLPPASFQVNAVPSRLAWF